jgi:hypothetical protein
MWWCGRIELAWDRDRWQALTIAVTKLQVTREVVSKIFWTDAVQTIKFTIRPIGRHHPRSSSLPHVGTGPTVSFISVTLPVSPFLSVSNTLCDSAWISSMRGLTCLAVHLLASQEGICSME